MNITPVRCDTTMDGCPLKNASFAVVNILDVCGGSKVDITPLPLEDWNDEGTWWWLEGVTVFVFSKDRSLKVVDLLKKIGVISVRQLMHCPPFPIRNFFNIAIIIYSVINYR